jgi:hypothetical protein
MSALKRHALQKLIFSDYGVTAQTFLYFRPRGPYQHDDASGRICLCRGASVAFNTLFNSVNYAKWHTYAQVDNVFLELRLQGKFKIVLTSELYGLDDAQSRTFHFDSSCEPGVPFISLGDGPAPQGEYPVGSTVCSFAGLTSFPNLYCEIIALSDDAVVHGGEYFTMLDGTAPAPVRLAVVINANDGENGAAALAEKLETAFLRDGSAPPCERVAVRVSGGAEPKPGGNAGATGNFARGLMEVLRDGASPFTHLLSLGGDVVISPDTVTRLCNLLALVRPSYAGAALSLARMDAGLRYRQTNSGAFWLGTGSRLLKNRYDMRDFTLVKKNEIVDSLNVASWSGVCIPLRNLNQKSFPLPLFTEQEAEAEFFLRAVKGVMTLNGLCLWREDNPEPPWSAYYRMRNTCAVTAARGRARPAGAMKRALRSTLVEHILRFRYAAADLALDGFEDFCRGVDWLKTQDPAELHKRVLAKAPAEKPVERHAYGFTYGQYERDKKRPEDSPFQRLLRKLTLNGMLLPPRRSKALPVAQTLPRQFYRLRRVFFYNEREQTGYLAARDLAALRALLRRWLAVRRLADERYAGVCAEYRERRDELRGISFWREYLHED